MVIDLNSDLGELPGEEGLALDVSMLEIVTSINIACGIHAGDPQRIVQLALVASEKGIAIGAHPGFPDRTGFGRSPMDLTPEEIFDWTLYQVSAVGGLLRGYGIRIGHIKPHGALYNLACTNLNIAESIVRACRAWDPTCMLIGLAGSELIRAAENLEFRFAREAFADRAYQANGCLLPRNEPGAVLRDPVQIAERSLEMLRSQTIPTVTGSKIPVRIDTICIHGDTPDAIAIARLVRSRLTQAGLEIGQPCPTTPPII